MEPNPTRLSVCLFRQWKDHLQIQRQYYDLDRVHGHDRDLGPVLCHVFLAYLDPLIWNATAVCENDLYDLLNVIGNVVQSDPGIGILISWSVPNDLKNVLNIFFKYKKFGHFVISGVGWGVGLNVPAQHRPQQRYSNNMLKAAPFSSVQYFYPLVLSSEQFLLLCQATQVEVLFKHEL